jgi:glycosyltransferase involved in cell wall biosynthesis
MKIAYLTNQYPHVRHTFIRREIVALEGHGVEVERFSIRRSGSDLVDPADQAELAKTRAILDAGMVGLLLAMIVAFCTRPIRFLRAWWTATKMGRRSDRGLLRHWVYFAEACVLRRWLRDAGVKHLHVHFATNPAVIAMLIKIFDDLQYSITIHGPEEWDRPEALSLREKYEQAKFIVAVSEFGRCQVYRWCGLDHWDKVHVVHCGVDASFLNETPSPVPDVPRLVNVAGLVEQKGHLMLLRALAKVHASGRNFEMNFVGDGHLRKILEAEILRLGLKDKVHLPGWKTNAEVRDHLRQSRAMIMPSFAENLPVAMMEALCLGRPVLGTYIAGVPELVIDGVDGWMVPAGAIDLLAKKIIEVLETPVDRLTALGLAGRQYVVANHDATIEAEKMVTLFRVACSDPAPI